VSSLPGKTGKGGCAAADPSVKTDSNERQLYPQVVFYFVRYACGEL